MSNEQLKFEFVESEVLRGVNQKGVLALQAVLVFAVISLFKTNNAFGMFMAVAACGFTYLSDVNYMYKRIGQCKVWYYAATLCFVLSIIISFFSFL